MNIPHDLDIEISVIGSALVDRCVPFDAKALSTADFYFDKHKQIWSVVVELDEENQPIDLIEISSRTAVKVSELSQMCLGIPQNLDTRKAVGQLKNLSTLRTLQKGFNQLANRAETCEQVDAILDFAEGLIQTVKSERGTSAGNARKLSDIFEQDVFPRLDKFVAGQMVKVPFGFTQLDRSTNGGAGLGELVILGAKPKSGKSGMIWQIARQQAAQGIGVYFCSREMLGYENGERFIAQTSQYNLNHFRAGLFQEAAEKMKVHARQVGDIPLFHDDKTKTVKGIKKEVQLLESNGVEITSIFVDYVQLMKASTKSTNKADVLEEIIYDLKDLATDMEKVVYVLAQFNRDGIDAERPKMSDFKGSSAIEMAGNLILFWTLNQEPNADGSGRDGEFWIEAGRNVAYDSFPITYIGDKTLFGFG